MRRHITKSEGLLLPLEDWAKTKVCPSVLTEGWLSHPALLGAPRFLPTPHSPLDGFQVVSNKSHDPFPLRRP